MDKDLSGPSPLIWRTHEKNQEDRHRERCGSRGLDWRFAYYRAQQAKIVRVQTGKVVRMESLVQTVSASGEIKPLKYINITANSNGRIVEIPIKEGNRARNRRLALAVEAGVRPVFRRTTTQDDIRCYVAPPCASDLELMLDQPR